MDIALGSHPRTILKLELLQHTGSFKPRGAFNKALIEPGARLLVAASGGNHGLAVAYVAEALGIEAEVFVPAVISPAKLAKLQATRATVVVTGDVYADALAASLERGEAPGAVLIHAYDDAAVIAGQGTVFRELAEQVPDVDAVVVAVGGGGLAAGAAAALDGVIDLIAVETEGTPTLHEALAAGTPVPVDAVGRAADSLGARLVGTEAFALLKDRVTAVLVSDDEVDRAQIHLWEEARIVSEPGGATAVAGVLSGKVDLSGYRHPAVIVCGGNTDLEAIIALT